MQSLRSVRRISRVRGGEKARKKAAEYIVSAARKEYAPAVYWIARADVWYLSSRLEHFVDALFDRERGNPEHDGKSDEALKAEIRDFASGQRAFAAGWLLLAAEVGYQTAIEDKERVFRNLTDAERKAAESLGNSRRPSAKEAR